MLYELTQGGWIMLPLALCSLLAVTVIIERFLYFRRISGTGFAEQTLSLVTKGRLNEAMAAVKNSSRPLAKILFAGLTNRQEPAKAMEAAGAAELSTMKRGLPVLDTIITLSPLLGLLGTIIGMINSFHLMAASGLGEPHAVTGGVAEALICTATGIAVAVISLIPYNYFLARIDRQTEVIEHYATRLELALGLAPRE